MIKLLASRISNLIQLGSAMILTMIAFIVFLTPAIPASVESTTVWPMSGRDQYRRGRAIGSVSATLPTSGWVKDLPSQIVGEIVVSAEEKIYFVSDRIYVLNPDGTDYVSPIPLAGVPTGSPAIDDERGYVYFGFATSSNLQEMFVVRYDKQLANPTVIFNGVAFYGGISPLIVTDDGTVLVTYGQRPRRIAAIGTNNWNVEICWVGYGSPAVVNGAVFTLCDGEFPYVGERKKIDLTTGQLSGFVDNTRGWQEPVVDGDGNLLLGYQTFTGAIFVGFYAKYDQNFNLIQGLDGFTTSRAALMNDSSSTVRIGYSFGSDSTLRHIGGENWGIDSNDIGGTNIFNTPPSVDAQDRILVGKGQKLLSIDPLTRVPLWESADLGGRIQNQPVIARNGAVYLGTANNRVVAIGAPTSGPTPTPTPTPSPPPCAGGSAPAAVYDDTILVPRAGSNGPTGIGSGGEPLGGRTPVILVHGIHGNRHKLNGVYIDTVNDPAANLNFKYFENLIRYLNSGGAAYNDHFRTYSFHYVSDHHTTQNIGKAFRDRIDERAEFAGKDVIIIAHSMGGIVARHYMLQASSNGPNPGQCSGDRVAELITLATPHHGTYGANGLARLDRFAPASKAKAAMVFAASDIAYWGLSGCVSCAVNLQLPNRVSLLWNNYDVRFTQILLNQLPAEVASDHPWSSQFNNRITAYYGDISADDPVWRPSTFDPLGLPSTIANGEANFDDVKLGAAAYLLKSVDKGTFSIQNTLAPNNDGLVPIESSRYDGAVLRDRIHCSGYNHLKMQVGSLKSCENQDILFESVRSRIIGKKVYSPPLFVGPLRVGFGNQTYGTGLGSTKKTIDIELSNMGDESLQVTSLSLAGENPDQFAFISAPSVPFTVQPTSNVHVTLSFNPTSPGLKTAELRAVNSSSNSVVVVDISATGLPESCNISFSPSSTFIATEGGSGEVMIGNIGCPWTVSALDDWIHTTASNDRVIFTVDPNVTEDIRYGTIIVSVYGRSYLYSISQDAADAPCWLSLSSDQSVLPIEGGSGSFYITTPNTCSWSLQSDSPWLTIAQEGPQVGSGQINFNVTSNFGSARSATITIQGPTTSAQYTVHQLIGGSAPFDFDGDGKTDVGIYRTAVGEWWYRRSSDAVVAALQFGTGTETVTPVDFTGDGKADPAFFRSSTGEWFILRSENGSFYSFPFGTAGDVAVPADYDGDGVADAAVFRPSNNTWYILRSSDQGVSIIGFGSAGDRPVHADFDGDGKADIGIFRAAVGEWWYMRSSDNQVAAFQFGNSTDKIVAADYTGDGKADPAFFRASSGEWFILRSEDGSFYSFPFGNSTDVPTPGDYDGDGTTDAAIFRPSNGTWYIQGSTSVTQIIPFGLSGDSPLPNAFIR